MTRTLTTAQRVAQLPALRPGVQVTIPLDLLPAYLNLYHVERWTARP